MDQNLCRVLLVEDNAPIQRALTLLLSKLGYIVTAAATVAEGLAQLDGQHVALVDLKLPDGTGQMLVNEIRRRELPMRVGIMSAGATAAAIKALALQNPDRFFAKPLDVNALRCWLGLLPVK